MSVVSSPHDIPLSWSRSDPERRFLFRSGRFTRVNSLFSFLLGGVLSGAFLAALLAIPTWSLSRMFLRQGPIPILIVIFSAWSFAILLLKSMKLKLQRRSLEFAVVPDGPGFVLTPLTAERVSRAIYETVDDPRRFVLFNRIMIALSNLRNLGRVADVEDMLRSQADTDEAMMETSYQLVQSFVWAIPVLGFIGTVLGLSDAIGGFGAVLTTSGEVGEMKSALQIVTAGLSLAFETTLQGLVAALVIQLLITSLKVSEQQFLDDCGEYCLRHIVGRLRLLPLEPLAEDAP
jgi:biopolymer transport protein ExbB/TolQ